MCGLVGVINFNHVPAQRTDLIKFMEQGLYADSLRGEDSTGLFVVHKDFLEEDPFVFKKALEGPDFVKTRQFATIVNDMDEFNLAIGHNRKATMGTVNNQNAHPFQCNHVTMVHNGSITNHRTLPEGSMFAVDSEAICNALSLTDDPKEVLERIDGAFALMWYNKNTHKFHIARNSERPLHCAVNSTGTRMYLASEEKMLDWILTRNHIIADKRYEITKDILFTWDLEEKSVFKYTKESFTSIDQSWGNYYSAYNKRTYGAANDTKKLENKSGESKRDERGLSDAAKDALKELDIKHNELIPFWPIEFHPYSVNSNVGWWEGIHEDSTCSVQIHHVRETDIEDPKLLYMARVQNVKNPENAKGWYTLILNKSIYEVKRDEGGAEDSGGDGEEDEHDDDDNTSDLTLCVGPYNQLMPIGEWNELVSGGCANCSAPLTSPERTHYTLLGDPLCEYCNHTLNLYGEGSIH